MADYDAQPGRSSAPEPDLSAAQREADDVDLSAGLRGVAGLVAGGRGVTDLLRDVAEFAARAIPGVDGAGVTLIDICGETTSVREWAVTVPFVEDIDRLQYAEIKEGPCVTCMHTRRPTVSGSLGSDSRWPHFGGRVARMGVHSALALPMMVGDQLVGAINTYARSRDAFGDHAVELGSQFAGPAAVSVHNAQLLDHAQARTRQLQSALGTRATIDQAIGIIRARSGVGPQVAFDRLVRMSQTENVKLHVVAERLVEEAVRRAKARQRE
ncbi:GAF and ANTAR domain-containing protein [Mycolicibacterium gadium]|uniref:Transcriptional regulator n=1 Tax=Mycolicibacterium gadium TaxID=1794 RepID=A0A7I7WNN5_MYCGU|nr:GAF and ANTAR domain-containing protein [Mycolicibacterium gadium]BBZ18582.1 transcriptional regulator [Mycolicibacterium gadium]